MINPTMSQESLKKAHETTHAITHAGIETIKKITEANLQAIHATTKAYFDGITSYCNLSQKLGEDNLQQSTKTSTATGK